MDTGAPKLTQSVDERRIEAAALLDSRQRGHLGQFFTPAPVAVHMARMLQPLSSVAPFRLLDPGAGVGSLAAAVVEELLGRPDGPTAMEVVAYEIDESLHPALQATLRACATHAQTSGRWLTWEVRGDYLVSASGSLGGSLEHPPEDYDAVIMNPPYRKIGAKSPERRAVERVGPPVANLYTAFLALAVAQLRAGGSLVAITPRSFANGPYHEPFRRFFFDRARVERMHIFDSRGAVFADSDVLQENIIFAALRTDAVSTVRISSSLGMGDDVVVRDVPASEVLRPADPHQFLRIPAGSDDAAIAETMAGLPATLKDLDLAVSTGRVVDFRAKEYLRLDPGEGTAPLIYPGHLRDGTIRWPGQAGWRKANALAIADATEKLLLPNETYVVAKRFTSKEERRRVSAFISSPQVLPGRVVAFENHLNVFHCRHRGLPSSLAHGLLAYLNSGLVDRYVRQFNGHTQINATDLRHLRYPFAVTLEELGARVRPGASQAEVDEALGEVLGEADLAVMEAA
jgi:adenine-specific DNA-methyltransferase